MITAMTCVCGRDRSFDQCCGAILEGTARAETAEDLMRARYAAYATGKADFIAESHVPNHRHEVDLDATRQWSQAAEWLGLEIQATEGGGPEDDEGTVEFTARYRMQGHDLEHREVAEFARQDGDWYFVDGRELKQAPYRRTERKVKPNEPCPCGSGVKFKKCCGRN